MTEPFIRGSFRDRIGRWVTAADEALRRRRARLERKYELLLFSQDGVQRPPKDSHDA